MNNLEKSWSIALKEEFEKNYFKELKKRVKEEYSSHVCYPNLSEVFEAFNLCSFNHVKAVIIGQDPYINEGQAHGLCFSVKSGAIPPSLRNIYQEISNDLTYSSNTQGDLTSWATQGVLLLNSVLTVRSGESNSHKPLGWEIFTDSVIEVLNTKKKNVAYLLWGAQAQKKGRKISEKDNLILKSAHPSPLSSYRGFFGNHHFSQTNLYLEKNGIEKINW